MSSNIICKRDIRMVILSDEHCGHLSGLTPPEYQGKFITENVAKHNKLTQIEKELWNFFETRIHQLQKEKKIDVLVNNGDFLDGDGFRSGGTEQLTTDRNHQVSMCKKIVELVNANTNIIVAGTAYHTGENEDWEEVLANEIDCKFESHAHLDINTVRFDIKHHVGSASVPHTRYTPIAREALWSKLWAGQELTPKSPHYLIRSHVHYFTYTDDGNMIAMTTPALQAFGSKYGSRRCSGIPTVGFVSFDINQHGFVNMRKHMAYLPAQVARATTIR